MTPTIESSVYFIQAANGGPVKIGKARDPVRRLKALQTSSPHKLVIRAAFPGDHLEEGALHMRFAPYRLRGEWFRPAPEIVALFGTEDPPSWWWDVRRSCEVAMTMPDPTAARLEARRAREHSERIQRQYILRLGRNHGRI